MNSIYHTESQIELEFDTQSAHVLRIGEPIGTIHFKTNHYHNRHCYLTFDFAHYNIPNTKWLFETIFSRVKRPLQVMIASDEHALISFLESGGFICKRKCYEVDAQRKDYIGSNSPSVRTPTESASNEKHYTNQKNSLLLHYAYFGDAMYQRCCQLMFERYLALHAPINPWTGSADTFFEQLPPCVVYHMADDAIENFAFIEDNEIAYVYGTNKNTFHTFGEILTCDLFKKYDSIFFEADDCDTFAMELKSLFTNQSESSFNTYILGK